VPSQRSEAVICLVTIPLQTVIWTLPRCPALRREDQGSRPYSGGVDVCVCVVLRGGADKVDNPPRDKATDAEKTRMSNVWRTVKKARDKCITNLQRRLQRRK
jgi:hypothetical protein